LTSRTYPNSHNQFCSILEMVFGTVIRDEESAQ
jgi:hypothetical protein